MAHVEAHVHLVSKYGNQYKQGKKSLHIPACTILRLCCKDINKIFFKNINSEDFSTLNVTYVARIANILNNFRIIC